MSKGATERTYSQRIHYCGRCGFSFGRSSNETIVYACNECNTWPMKHAVVSWTEVIPDPDPLEALLVDSSDGGEDRP